MPKQTFFNLQEPKKNKIIESALDEFSTYDFNTASINRIVEKAQIAKGSFYQYFEDKKDLYKYIIHHIMEHKMQYFAQCHQSDNFFSYFKNLFDAGIKFGTEHPKYASIALFLHNDTALREEILGEMEEKTHVYLKSLLEKGQKNGDIRQEINLDVAAYFLYHLNISIGEIYCKSHTQWENNEDYRALTHSVIDILENGIKNHSKEKL